MGERRSGAWRVVGCLLGWSGCLGYPDPPPPPLEQSESSGVGMMTTGLGTAGDATVESGATTEVGTTTGVGEASTTGPIAECGNGDVEEGEDCDGTDWNGATCESLGHDPGSLACTETCTFDVSGCVPPGMVLVPGGIFEMGSNDYANEMPIRQVQVNTFWMDETEVTVEAYAACVDAGECSEQVAGGADCNWMVAGRENHPENCASWADAEVYCAWAGGGTKRLPTEAEWEKAARGTDAREYPWGNSPLPSCTHVVMSQVGSGGCGQGSTWPVGSKPLGDSPYGAHDMSGNVWEWVADWYAGSYDVAETDNPTGPEKGTLRVLRGGEWEASSALGFRAAYRFAHPPSGYDATGFRCARTPPAVLRIGQE